VPRLKIDDDELDIDELENAEYDDTRYERYDGEIPPKDTVLVGYVKSAWLTETQAGDRMIKVLFVADGNTGDEEDYNGLPVWENLALTTKSKFKWAPFFNQFGLTVRMFAKQTMLAAEDDNVGAPITKIGKWSPGEDSRCAIVTGRERYNGAFQVRVAEWMDEPEDDEDEEELDEEELDEEELEEEEYEEEEEEEPPPPARTRRAASGKGTASPATKRAAPSKPAATKSSTRKPAPKAAAKPARGKAKASGYDDEPPF